MQSSISPQPSADEGVYGPVFQLAYPVVLAMLAETVMGLVDTLFMGWVSVAAQAAVGLGGIVVWTFGSFFTGTLNVVNTFVSQHFGAGNFRRCGPTAWHGLVLAAAFSILVFGGLPLVSAIVGLFGTDADVSEIASGYAVIRFAGLPFVCFKMAFDSFLRGIGDTRTPMKVSLAMMALNVPLNYWLVFGGLGVPPLGADGAAYATVAASVIGAVVLGIVFLSGEMRRTYATGIPSRIEGAELRSLLAVGLPIGLQWVLDMATWTVFTVMVARLGKTALAANNIVLQGLHVSFMPGVGLSVAATTLVGQALGARDIDRAELHGYAALKLAIVYMFGMGVVFFVFGRAIGERFSPSPEVVDLCARLFMFAAAFQIFDAMWMVCGGILRGAGDTRWPAIVSVVFAWTFFMPATWSLMFHFERGVVGGWGAATVYIAGLGMLHLWRVRAGPWRQLSVIDAS